MTTETTDYTLTVEFEPLVLDSFDFAPTTMPELSDLSEHDLPLDAHLYPEIDFSVSAEERNAHTDSEVWTAWYEGEKLYGTMYSPEVLDAVYLSGLESMGLS